MNTYPTTSFWDLLRLIGSMIAAVASHPRQFDAGAVLAGWMRSVTRRYESPNVILNLLFTRLLLVSGRDLSQHVLEDAPGSGHFVAGTMKKKVMNLLAPGALTIAEGERWQGLRTYNVEVLTIEGNDGRRRALVARVERAFSVPVGNVEQIRSAMGHVMLNVIFGERQASPALLADFQILYDNMNMRNAFLGRDSAERRERFYAELAQQWRQATAEAEGDAPLLSCGRAALRLVEEYNFDEETFLQQVPHWMFTFIGSGTDLLARTLAMITAREDAFDRARNEVGAAGSLDDPAAIDGLVFIEACLREAGRLFPPVAQTLHRSPEGDGFEGVEVAPGSELIHFFPFTNRDLTVDSTANDFVPERWLDGGDGAARYPNLFLSGARACPGEDIIVLICKAAIAQLLARHGLQVGGVPSLAVDPVPVSFPEDEFVLRY